MRDLIFTYNWNNKLDCKTAFTTIRLRQDNAYKPGNEYKVVLQTNPKADGIPKGIAKIVEIRHFKLSSLNEFMAYIDTGYSKRECEQIIRRMYPKVNFEEKELSLILLKYTNKAIQTKKEEVK